MSLDGTCFFCGAVYDDAIPASFVQKVYGATFILEKLPSMYINMRETNMYYPVGNVILHPLKD